MRWEVDAGAAVVRAMELMRAVAMVMYCMVVFEKGIVGLRWFVSVEYWSSEINGRLIVE